MSKIIMDIGKIIQSIKSLFSKKGADHDIRELMVMSAKDPSNMRLKLRLGELYFKEKDPQNGIAIFREVAEQYVESSFFLKAVAIYKNILKFSPGSVEFNEKLGELYQRLGMNNDAAQQFKIVVQYYLNRGLDQDAIRAGKKLIDAEPEEVRHQVRLAEIYFNFGKQEESLQEYEKIAKKLRREMKQIDVLAEVYEKILLKKPNETTLLRELCLFYLKLRNPQKTIAKIRKYQLEEDEKFKPIYEKAMEIIEAEK
jgi:predicted Zn-dependent protease